MPNWPNYYELLDLPTDATDEEIRYAYREKARQFHPDTRQSEMETGLFRQIQEAYEILSDSPKRKQYNKKLENEIEVSHPISMRISYSRSKLSRLDEPQLIYSLLELAPKKNADGGRLPVNICLLIDRSTSMKGERMDIVKTAAIELSRRLQREDTLSIIAFSDRAEVIVSAGKSNDPATIVNQIRMINADGGTEIFRGLNQGYREIRKHYKKSPINHIIILTDGRTYGDEEACIDLARQMATEGVRITSLGIGSEWNDDFTDKLAAVTGGSSYYISDVRDINNFLQNKYLSLAEICAEQVVLNLNTSEGVELKSVYRLQPEPTELITKSEIPIGSIPDLSQVDIILEFVLSPIPDNINRYQIATGELHLVTPPDINLIKKLPIRLTRLFGSSPKMDKPPRKIFQALSLISLYRMQNHAYKELADGKVHEASVRLQRIATHMLSLGEDALAEEILKESKIIDQTNRSSVEGKKQIKFGTRSLLLPSQAGEVQ